MSEITLKAIKTKDTISFRNKKEYLDFLKEIPEGEEIVISISLKRSLAQNKALYGWIKIIANEIGESPEAVKAWLLCKFLGCEETEIEGKTYTVPLSSSKLNKKEFADLLTQIDIFAAETLNIKLPNNQFI